MGSAPRAALLRFLALYAALYAGFGVQSPFLPVFLAARGLSAQAIGLVLALGVAVRLVAGPMAGHLADRYQAPRAVFSGFALAAALAALTYLPAQGLWPLLLVSVFQAEALAPLAPLADTLALGAAAPSGSVAARPFDYGWVRGAGSAAFIFGSILAGQAAERLGISIILWLNAGLLAAAALCVLRVPRLLPSPAAESPRAMAALLHLPSFARLMLVVALILGSHALHDSFAVIRWNAAGIGSGTAGWLWSEQVAAEFLVFLFLGRPLLERLGPARAAMVAASAGVLRWAVMAQTAWLPAMMVIEPLHGLTFALLHLAAMRLMAEIVPPRLAATALTLYGTVAIGAATALATLISGPLYARFGAEGFWVMAALCAAALPIAAGLREPGYAITASSRGE